MYVNLDEIFKKVAEEFDTDPNKVQAYWKHSWRCCRFVLENEYLEDVLLHNFGTYESKITRINYLIKNNLKAYKEERNTRAYTITILNFFWEARRKKVLLNVK